MMETSSNTLLLVLLVIIGVLLVVYGVLLIVYLAKREERRVD